MAIDVDAITKQVVEAMRASVGDLPKEELAAVEAQAKALAAALARIGEERLAGHTSTTNRPGPSSRRSPRRCRRG